MFLFGVKIGTGIIIGFLSIIFLMYMIDIPVYLTRYSADAVSRYFASFTCISLIAYIEEYIRIKTQKTIEQKNSALAMVNMQLKDELAGRKLAEEKLHKSEEEFKEIVENINEAVFTINKNGILTYMSPAIKQIGGYDPSDIVGKPFTEFIYDEDIILAQQRFQEVLTGDIKPTVYRMLNKNKEIRWIQVSTKPKFAGNELAGIQGVLIDFTEKKNAEDELAKERNQLRTLIDTLPDLIYIKDRKGRFITCNKATAEALGKSKPEEIIGNTDFDFIEHDLAEQFFAEEQEIIATGKPMVNKNTQNPEKTTWGLNTKVPFYDIGDKIGGLVCINHDITGLKKAEEEKERIQKQLNRVQKMDSMGRLAGAVAHDLNHILAGLVTYPDIILMDMDEDDPMQEKIEAIKESGKRAADVVEDLLNIARGGIGTFEVININDVIEEATNSPEIMLVRDNNPDVIIETELEPDINNIICSKVHVVKILYNLINNAAEAIEGKGQLSIKTQNRELFKPVHGYENIQPGKYIVLSVSDTGVGISEDDLQKIFEPYFTKKVLGRSGSGIGLTVVWNAVKDHGGFIDIKSKTGAGTVFNIYFPVTEEELVQEEEKIELDKITGNRETILVVDDEEALRESLYEILKDLNYLPVTCSSGEEALIYLRTHEVDLMLLDMILEPEMDGLETYKEIKKFKPDQKVILISGYSASEKILETQNLGAGEFLKKPFTIAEIGQAINKELSK